MGKKEISKQQIINYSQGKNLIVRLRGKRLANNNISLYLDYYKGYTQHDGKTKTFRKIEYLKLYLINNPQTSKDRQANDENLSLAQSIRNMRESDIKHNAAGLVSPLKKKINFFDYCDDFINNYQKKDIKMVVLAVRQFREYANEPYLTPLNIDFETVKGFRDYLLNKFNGETPHSVFARFKKILKAATNQGLFTKNPGENIICPAPKGIPKEILSPDEIIKMYKADCPNPEIKRAFLFCLNTGLRFVDVNDLYFRHISNSQIRKKQLKTGADVIIDLNNNAVKLLGTIGKPDEKVFILPSLTGCLKTVKKWAKNAGIDRNITWHSARHSFATILLINQTDIKTVSNLLGHSNLEHTQKYTHIVDALKKKAVETMPKFDD